jgi:hypothetical protein
MSEPSGKLFLARFQSLSIAKPGTYGILACLSYVFKMQVILTQVENLFIAWVGKSAILRILEKFPLTDLLLMLQSVSNFHNGKKAFLSQQTVFPKTVEELACGITGEFLTADILVELAVAFIFSPSTFIKKPEEVPPSLWIFFFKILFCCGMKPAEVKLPKEIDVSKVMNAAYAEMPLCPSSVRYDILGLRFIEETPEPINFKASMAAHYQNQKTLQQVGIKTSKPVPIRPSALKKRKTPSSFTAQKVEVKQITVTSNPRLQLENEEESNGADLFETEKDWVKDFFSNPDNDTAPIVEQNGQLNLVGSLEGTPFPFFTQVEKDSYLGDNNNNTSSVLNNEDDFFFDHFFNPADS